MIQVLSLMALFVNSNLALQLLKCQQFLSKKALAGKFNGKLIDTTRAIAKTGSIEIVTPDHEDAVFTQQLTCLLTQLVASSRISTWVSVPAIEDGF